MGKIWKNNGPEDVFLQSIFKKGRINKFTKPQDLKKNYPDIFQDFSLEVVRNHLNVLKRSEGLYLGDSNDDDETKNEKYELMGSIKENKLLENVIYKNYPFIYNTYIDPDTSINCIIMAVDMPSGAQNIKFEVDEAGLEVKLKYNWAKTMYSVEELYKADIAAKKIHSYHPKILALKNALEKKREKIDKAPLGEINITLPFKVHTSSSTYKIMGVQQKDGTLVVLLELTGYATEYTKTSLDSIVKFN